MAPHRSVAQILILNGPYFPKNQSCLEHLGLQGWPGVSETDRADDMADDDGEDDDGGGDHDDDDDSTLR